MISKLHLFWGEAPSIDNLSKIQGLYSCKIKQKQKVWNLYFFLNSISFTIPFLDFNHTYPQYLKTWPLPTFLDMQMRFSIVPYSFEQQKVNLCELFANQSYSKMTSWCRFVSDQPNDWPNLNPLFWHFRDLEKNYRWLDFRNE